MLWLHPQPPERGSHDEATTVADRVEQVAAALRSHNIEAIVVETGAEARDVVLGLIPDGAEVHSGKSKTLEDIGLYAELVESGRYDALRPRLSAMDRATQGDEMRTLVAAGLSPAKASPRAPRASAPQGCVSAERSANAASAVPRDAD